MDGLTVIKTRRSVRSYQKKPIPREVLEDIIDCARFAPSANNRQPWEFVVVTDAPMRKKLADIAEYGKFIADAPACAAVFCEETKYYLEDGSAAVENLMLGAWAHGVGSCWVAGDKKPYADTIGNLLGLPGNMKLVALISLGYPAEPPGQKSKRALKDVLHWERWG